MPQSPIDSSLTATAKAIEELVFPPVKLHKKSLGRIPGRIGFVMYLFFKEQRELAQRLAMIEIIKEIRSLVGSENLGWWASSATSKMYFDRKKKFDLSKHEQHLLNPNRHFAIAMSSIDAGGDDLQEVSDNAQRFFVEFSANEMNQDVGKLRLYVPASWALSLPPEHSLMALFAQWSQTLNALHGIFGIGVGLPMQNLAQIDRSYYYDLGKASRQEPGLICDDPWKVPMAKGMSSVSWLTYVRDEWLDKVGGRQAVKAKCVPPVIAIDLDQGLIVQAGPQPEIHRDRLAHYRAVAKIFKPLRVQAARDRSVVLEISSPETAADAEVLRRDSEAYLSRFD